jgi:serine/threonine protein kinase
MKESDLDYVGVLDSKYILQRKLWEGTLSSVYKSFDKFSKEEYAIKVFDDTSSFEWERSFNEIISKSQKPFFVKYISSSSGYLDIGETHELKKYIIFEFYPKGDLYEYIKVNSKGLQEQNCKVMAYKILLAIQSLHIMGICHLDIKPDNILIYGDNFEIKIGDFGVSSSIYRNNEKVLQSGDVGTYGYKAPEIIEGKDYDGEKADVFSLGVLLFVLLNGIKPFPTAEIIDHGSKVKQLYRYLVTNSNYYWIIMGKTGLPLEFIKLFMRMVSYNPNDRPKIREILDDDWFKEITNLKEDEFKIYEENLIKELKEREDMISKEKT